MKCFRSSEETDILIISWTNNNTLVNNLLCLICKVYIIHTNENSLNWKKKYPPTKENWVNNTRCYTNPTQQAKRASRKPRSAILHDKKSRYRGHTHVMGCKQLPAYLYVVYCWFNNSFPDKHKLFIHATSNDKQIINNEFRNTWGKAALAHSKTM